MQLSTRFVKGEERQIISSKFFFLFLLYLTGVHLDTDFKTCLVNNQCGQETHCSPGECINTDDGYRCECPSGYIEKAKRCHDVNECEIGNHHCSHECK